MKRRLDGLKKGAFVVNTARGAICVAEDVAAALESGHINGYAGGGLSPLKYSATLIHAFVRSLAKTTRSS